MAISNSSFTRRRLKVKIKLGHGAFKADENDEGYSILEADGLRIDAEINMRVNGKSESNISIWGLHPSTMNAITTIQDLTMSNGSGIEHPHSLELFCVDNSGNEALIMSGQIFNAIADYNTQPAVPIRIHVMDYEDRLSSYPNDSNENSPPIGSTSFKDAKSAKEIYQVIIDKTNASRSYPYKLVYQCEDKPLTDVNVHGGFTEQMNAVARQAGHSYFRDGNSIIVTDKAYQISNEEPYELDSESGMIGYPVLTKNGCNVSCLFNPYFRVFQPVKVKSQIVKFIESTQDQNGNHLYYSYTSPEMTGTIQAMSHKLQSEMQGGAWNTELQINLFMKNAQQQTQK